MRYVVILEQGENGIGAYVPDFPGCVAVGETKEVTLRLLGEAVEQRVC
jgi:predicted RNase H-like HicB family nuclease